MATSLGPLPLRILRSTSNQWESATVSESALNRIWEIKSISIMYIHNRIIHTLLIDLEMYQEILENLNIATMSESLEAYGLITDGAIALNEDRIAWCGKRDKLPSQYQNWPRRNLNGCLVTPALIDCHTHIVYGGNRAKEFELRLEGATYEEILNSGGGIHSTVRETQKLTEDELVACAIPRVDTLIAEGVSTIEIKSGYGQDKITELKMLRAARKIAQLRPIRIKTSFLGAHAVPSEYGSNALRYIEQVCIPALEQAHSEGLVDAVDGFCEKIAFSTVHIERLFGRAQELGIPVKLHAEQLSNCGGTQLAARYKALSVDHLEYANEADVVALAESGTIAVLLPGAFYFLRESQIPPIDDLRNHCVPIAIATDCNPGSSPLVSILTTMNLACTLFQLTPEEALAGTTREAAKALGLSDTGRIEPGLRADLAVWNVSHPSELSYHIGFNPLQERIFGGVQ